MSEDVCKVRLFDSELAKDKYNEYQKTVDIYVELNNIYVNVEINREYFKNVEKRNFLFADKLHTMLLQRGDNVNDLEIVKGIKKFGKMENDYHIIFITSLKENLLTFKGEELQYKYMFPLDFEEYLMALDNQELIDFIKRFYIKSVIFRCRYE